MPGLLYPAYQKLYSAVQNLKRFSKENSFFDNISSLDSFFSEYRSTTLVLQESLAHTPYLDLYKKHSDGIWDPFFNAQRVKTIHQHPSEYKKSVDITVYLPNKKASVISKEYTIENDVPLNILIDSLKSFFMSIDPVEVFFSAGFCFIELDSGSNLWGKIIPGIKTLEALLERLYEEIGESCPLCNNLRKEIQKIGITVIPKDFFLVNDYIYYPQSDEFERAERFAAVLTGKTGEPFLKPTIASFVDSPHFNYDNTPFGKFVLMHVLIQSTDIMPTIMTVFKDDTYTIDTFHASIKTTFYRKINELADLILQAGVKEVYLMYSYIWTPYMPDLGKLTLAQRSQETVSDFLVFTRIDDELNEEEYVFDGRYINNMEYIVYQMKHGKKDRLDLSSRNMSPIVASFKEIMHKDGNHDAN